MDGLYQNDEVLRRKISDWMSESIGQVHASGNPVDVHVDRFIEVSDLGEADLIRASIELFSAFIDSFRSSGSSAACLRVYYLVGDFEF